jgi:PilZ domain-containing protein
MSSLETEQPPTASSERRKRGRRQAQLRGLIVLLDGSAALECRIEDVSGAGARINTALGRDIPEHFYLLATGKEVAYECMPAWRRDNEYGLKIRGIYPMESLRTGPLQFLRRLKVERLRA